LTRSTPTPTSTIRPSTLRCARSGANEHEPRTRPRTHPGQARATRPSGTADGPHRRPGLRPHAAADVIDIPINHPVFGWNCRRLCRSHADLWNSQTGLTLGEFIRTTGPIHHRLRLGPTPGCRVPAWSDRHRGASR
jgi:hypothetical protein